MVLPMVNPCAEGALSCELAYRLTSNETLASVTGVVVDRLASVLGLVLMTLLARWLLHRLVDRIVRRAESGGLRGRLSRLSVAGTSLGSAVGVTDGEPSQRRVARARAMGSLLKSIVTGALFTILVMMVVAELGYPIGPLLASAGILGVALGFGAQSLVKDFLSGIFMILEDQYGVGDVIALPEVTGTVEGVSLRVTRLRDEEGTVWYVRNGEILRVGNQSQTWAQAVVDVAVPGGAGLPTAQRVVAEVARGMWENGEYRGLIVDEPEVAEPETVSADVSSIRVTIKTAPQEHWRVSREFRELVRQRLAREGVAPPSRLVWPGGQAADPD